MYDNVAMVYNRTYVLYKNQNPILLIVIMILRIWLWYNSIIQQNVISVNTHRHNNSLVRFPRYSDKVGDLLRSGTNLAFGRIDIR